MAHTVFEEAIGAGHEMSSLAIAIPLNLESERLGVDRKGAGLSATASNLTTALQAHQIAPLSVLISRSLRSHGGRHLVGSSRVLLRQLAPYVPVCCPKGSLRRLTPEIVGVVRAKACMALKGGKAV